MGTQLITLMRKDIEIAVFAFDEDAGVATSAVDVMELDAAPLAMWNQRVQHMRDFDFAQLFRRWWSNRIVPTSRIGLARGMRALGEESTSRLALHSYGLSLSDQFWVKPSESSLAWSDVNFFTNDFDDEVGKALAGWGGVPATPLSPSAASDGNLPKMWRVDEDGTRTLCKAGSGVLKQEPFNEAAATKLYASLISSDEYVPYSIEEGAAGWLSTCPCMVDESHAFVPAKAIFNSILENAGSPDREGMLLACEKLGIAREKAARRIDEMLVLDFILGNIDRHEGNFGAIMDSDTGKYVGMAPIFDSGLSLMCFQGDRPQNVTEMTANPYAPRQTTQLAMAEDFNWLDAKRLSAIPDVVARELEKCPSRYMDSARLDFIHSYVESACEIVLQASDDATRGDKGDVFVRAEAYKKAFAEKMTAKSGGTIFAPDENPPILKSAGNPGDNPIVGSAPAEAVMQSRHAEQDKTENYQTKERSLGNKLRANPKEEQKR